MIDAEKFDQASVEMVNYIYDDPVAMRQKVLAAVYADLDGAERLVREFCGAALALYRFFGWSERDAIIASGIGQFETLIANARRAQKEQGR